MAIINGKEPAVYVTPLALKTFSHILKQFLSHTLLQTSSRVLQDPMDFEKRQASNIETTNEVIKNVFSF